MVKQKLARLPVENLGDALIFRAMLTPDEQSALVEELRAIVARAPLYSPKTPSGKPLSVKMTSAGAYGWYSDAKGYRYISEHPSGAKWPAIPEAVLAVWRRVVPQARMPESCLINYYGAEARMGLHQDRDEADLSQPVVSISLGDDGLFRIGGSKRAGPTRSTWLTSGDVLVLAGESRRAFHGIDRIRPGTSLLLRNGGRLNLTLRVVT